MDIKKFYQYIAILFLNRLIIEVQEAFDMADFPRCIPWIQS